jgi:hypothetical protein
MTYIGLNLASSAPPEEPSTKFGFTPGRGVDTAKGVPA